PSNPSGSSPRKSRILGSAVASSRSRNSHIRAPRRVTLAPIDIPARSLKAAIDLRARVIAGFCPVMIARSATAASRSFASRTASPTPMFTTIFSRRGTRMGFGRPSSRWRPGSTSLRYHSCSRGPAISDLRLAAHAHPRLHAVLDAVTYPGGLAARATHQLDVGQVDEELRVDDPALLQGAPALRALTRRAGVLLGAGDPLDHDPVAA